VPTCTGISPGTPARRCWSRTTRWTPSCWPTGSDGHAVTVAGALTLTVADSLQGDAFVAFPPAAVALHPRQPDGSPRNTWPATITGMQRHGDNLRIQLAGPIGVAADVTPAAAAHLHLDLGQEVWVAVKAAETRAYPAEPGAATTATGM
jgi:molybdate transport system ATP-binding protein